MKRNTIRIALFAIFVFMAIWEVHAVSWQSDMDSALESARSSGQPIMADFYTDWCGWCKKMDADTYSDSRVNELSNSFICVRIDAERYADVARKYAVSGYPTAVFLDSAGKVMDRAIGYRPPAVFASIMEKVLQRAGAGNAKQAQETAKTSNNRPAAAADKPTAANEPENKIDIKETMQNLQKKLEKMKNNNMELQGIIYNKESPRALVNNKMVKVGDVVEGATLTKIEEKSVEFQQGDKKIILKIE